MVSLDNVTTKFIPSSHKCFIMDVDFINHANFFRTSHQDSYKILLSEKKNGGEGGGLIALN